MGPGGGEEEEVTAWPFTEEEIQVGFPWCLLAQGSVLLSAAHRATQTYLSMPSGTAFLRWAGTPSVATVRWV